MFKRDKIKSQLIKAARKAFSAGGYSGTTMEDIAKAAGKAKSTLYYYFDSKEDAFQTVVDLEVKILKDKLLAIIEDPKKTARRKLEEYILTRWEGFRELGRRYRTMRHEFLYNSDFVEKYRKQYDEEEKQLLCRILKQGIQQKEFRITSDEVEMVTLTILLSMKALEVPFFAKEDSNAATSGLKSLIDILFYGIVAQ